MDDEDKRWVMGVSVDDEIIIGFAEVDISEEARGASAYDSSSITIKKVGDLPHRSQDMPSRVDLKQTLIDCLGQLIQMPDFATALANIDAVGVSTIGLADHHTRRLINLRRKELIWERDEEYILDFGRLFSKQILSIRQADVIVHNDATAKCLAYHGFRADGDSSDVFCLVNFSEGVNIGVANGTGPLSASNLHPELGHAYPPLHPRDQSTFEKSRYSGCPAHVTCYEGLLSSRRIEKQWGHLLRGEELRDLENSPALDIIAWYGAHICWTAALAIAPERIILSGSTITESLAAEIRRHFKILNRGPNQFTVPYLRYQAMSDMNRFIRIAQPMLPELATNEVRDISGLMGAFELARLHLKQNESGT